MKTREQIEWEGAMDLTKAVAFASFFWIFVVCVVMGAVAGMSWIVDHVHISFG